MSKKKSVLFGKKAVGQLLEQLQPDIVQGVGMPPYRMTLGYKRAIHFVTLRNYCYEDYPDYYISKNYRMATQYIRLMPKILRKSKRDASTAIHWENKDKICSSFSSRAFSEVIFEAMNWKWSCRYQCRGICRGKENAKFLIFELDESRILIGKNQYEQIEGCSIDLKCRLYRSKWIQSIAASDVMKFGQVVENPMIGAIPSRNEVQRELDDLLMSM